MPVQKIADLPVELRSLIVGYRQTVPARTDATTPVKRRAVDNAANAEAASIRKRPASPTPVDDAPAAKSPKTDGAAADAPAPGDDALVPGDNYQYDDYGGGGGTHTRGTLRRRGQRLGKTRTVLGQDEGSARQDES